MESIAIIGSSGHAKVVIDTVRQEGRYNVAGLLDPHREKGEDVFGCPVLGREDDLPDLAKPHALAGTIVAIGDNFLRSRVTAKVREFCPDLPFVNAIHPKAAVAAGSVIGEGTVVMAGACVNPGCSIGQGCILNTHASLDHDSTMGDFSSLAPRATTGGACRIGRYSAVGIGVVVVHNTEIGDHAVIGAGSLVLKSVEALTVAYGHPAEAIRSRAKGERYL